MDREFLLGLGVGEAAAEEILAAHASELEAVRAQAEELGQRLGQKEEELLGARRDFALDDALRSFGAKNNRAVRALLDMSAIVFEDGKLSGLDEQLEKLKGEAGYLFGGDEAPRIVAPSGKSRRNGFSFKFTGVR